MIQADSAQVVLPALSAILGAVVGGSGVSYVLRLAMVESLRNTFATTKDSVSPVLLQEKLDDTKERIRLEQKAFTEDLRREFQGIFGTAAGRIEREHADLTRDLQRAIGALDRATQEVRESGANNAAALATAKATQLEVDALRRLCEEHSHRLGLIQTQMEDMHRRMEAAG